MVPPRERAPLTGPATRFWAGGARLGAIFRGAAARETEWKQVSHRPPMGGGRHGGASGALWET